MNRRMFAQSMGGAAVLSALGSASDQPRRKAGLYRLDYLYFSDAAQARRFDELLAPQAPLLARNTTALGVFSVVVGPHVPAAVVLAGFESFDQMEAADKAAGNITDAPHQRASRVLLRPADFSPALEPLPETPKASRIFELRTDYAPAGAKAARLRERYAGPEMEISQRAGICPMLYADVLAGPNMPGLTCLIPFAGLAERQRAWNAFAADPDWIKLHSAGGPPLRQSEIVLLSPAPFSPIQ
jgi:hypothetical protein